MNDTNEHRDLDRCNSREKHMPDRTSQIFENPIPASVVSKASRKKASYIREYGDDSKVPLALSIRDIPVLRDLGVRELLVGPSQGSGPGVAGVAGTAGAGQPPADLGSDPKALVVGNIRMGFGHYRISMAIASAARQRGLNPYWFDLHAFEETTGGKIIEKLNGMYSMGSRWSQKYPLFNRLVWEPLNSEGFRKLSYNAADQKVAELMAPPCALLPRDVPYIATHAWPAQAAVHAGLSHVVNVIPDNWPMALHLSEGAIHCIQSPSAWQGYKTLRGMEGDAILEPMPAGSLRYTGHYIDHEIVSSIEADTEARLARIRDGKPLRVLLTVGGAGAQGELFRAIIESLLPAVKDRKVCLLVNVGDHRAVLDRLVAAIPGLAGATVHSGNWAETRAFAEAGLSGDMDGVHLFHDEDIFAAVYATNLLMRASDLLVTKPSELAYYPVPKLHLRRVGGHEAWGAIRSAELGDGSVECSSLKETLAMLGLVLGLRAGSGRAGASTGNGRDTEALELMNRNILAAHRAGIYDGAYRAVDIALGRL